MQILVKFLYEAVRPSTCDKLFHLVITQAGTLSGNPLAMTAGLKTLEILDRPGAYEHLEKITGRLIEGILQAGRDAGHAVTGGHISGKLGISSPGSAHCCIGFVDVLVLSMQSV